MLAQRVHKIFWIVALLGWWLTAQAQSEAIRFELQALPDLTRHVDLLAQPGYLAVALENNGLSPSLSSKLKVGEGGRSAEIRNAVLRFTGQKDGVYSYEAGVRFGIGDAKLTFPVTIDASKVAEGKVVVTMKPPLAQLFPTELTDRIRIKTQLIANPAVQRKVLAYLEGIAKNRSADGDQSGLIEAILLDAYNKSGGPGVPGGRDVGDAVPLSDQWLLILTLAIWLVVVPVFLFLQRRRHARPRPA